MDFATLIGQLGPDARDAVSQFYFGDDGVPTYGDTVPDVTPLTGVQRDGTGIAGILTARDYDNTNAYQNINPNAYLDDDKEGASRLSRTSSAPRPKII